jgi:hypothetical protein
LKSLVGVQRSPSKLRNPLTELRRLQLKRGLLRSYGKKQTH